MAEVAVFCTLNWERDFPCMWHQTHTCTIQTMVEGVSVARKATNGESSSNSVSTQELCQIAPQSIYISINFLGGACPQTPLGSTDYTASRCVAGGLRPPKELPSKISGSAPDAPSNLKL